MSRTSFEQVTESEPVMCSWRYRHLAFPVRPQPPEWVSRTGSAGFATPDEPLLLQGPRTGCVHPGDPLEWMRGAAAYISLGEMVQHFYASTITLEQIQRALGSPIAVRSRVEYEDRLTSKDG